LTLKNKKIVTPKYNIHLRSHVIRNENHVRLYLIKALLRKYC